MNSNSLPAWMVANKAEAEHIERKRESNRWAMQSAGHIYNTKTQKWESAYVK